MATNSKTVAHANRVLDLLGGTSITAPGTVDLALHKATTLSANAASGQNQISLPISPIVGTQVTINPIGATPETFTVNSVSGAGPYTVTLSGNLANAHNSGEHVRYDPGEDLSKLSEPSGGSYARKSVTNNATNFPAASNGQKALGVAQDFAQATADWGLITHVVVYNGSAGWYYGALSTPKLIQQNDTLQLPASTGLVLTED
jgi:hypothetical protein